MKKASKGEIKQEPPSLSDGEDFASQSSSQQQAAAQLRKVAVVNPTKTQHKTSSRKHKIKKESSLLNGQNKVAFFEVFKFLESFGIFWNFLEFNFHFN